MITKARKSGTHKNKRRKGEALGEGLHEKNELSPKSCTSTLIVLEGGEKRTIGNSLKV